MDRKTLFLALITLLLLVPVYSQDTQKTQDTLDSFYYNTIKLNMAAAILNNVSIYYERLFNEHWSAQLGAGYKFGGEIPKFIGLGEFAITSDSKGIRGFSVTPEVRYHFRNCECGERTGLYIGAYARATKFYGDIIFNYWDGTQYIDVGAAGNMQEYGIGLQLGYQFTIKKRFIVDLMFMGPRTSFHRLKLELDSDFASEVIPIIEKEINERLDWFGMDHISMSDDPSAKVNFRFTNFRYGVGIGYIF